MKRRKIAAAAALLLAGLLLDSRYHLQTSEYCLRFDDLPREFDGFRILLLSDLHGWTFGRDNCRLVDAVQGTRPDMIAITGDMAGEDGEMSSAAALMNGISGIAPVYFVNGNHEWGDDITDSMRSMMTEHGARCLSNEYECAELGGSRIVVCGAEDRNGFASQMKPEQLSEKLREEYPDDFTLWLYHRNDFLELYSGLPADLVLSGHAHGGIIRLPFVGGLLSVYGKFFAEYDNGIYEKDGTSMVVSRGLGNSVPIPRFLNRPELAVITLRCDKKSE